MLEFANRIAYGVHLPRDQETMSTRIMNYNYALLESSAICNYNIDTKLLKREDNKI